MRALFTALVAAVALTASPVNADSLAIVDAKVWAGGKTPLENGTVVITNGRITAVGTNIVLPADVRRIDGYGKVVTLPLDAAATQIGLVEVAGSSDTDDRAVSSGPFAAAFDTALALDSNQLSVQQARSDGVGHAMDFPGPAGSSIFAGLGARIDLAQPGLIERARAALLVTAGGAAADVAGGSRGAIWGQLRNALAEARVYSTRTASTAPRDQLLNHAEIEALLPVLNRRIPLAVVAQREADIRQAVAVARDFGLRLVIMGGAEAWRAADLLAGAKVPVILDPLDALPTSYDTIGARRDNAALLAKKGVEIAFSVSAQGIYLSYNAGPALREGAGIAVANGLPYAAALRAITVAAGAIWDGGAPAPMLALGRPANLVLWDGDPLEPASAPVLVMSAGREVALQTRQKLLRDRYRPASK